MGNNGNILGMEPWLDLRAAAAYTNLSVGRVRKAYLANDLKVSRVTGKILTKKSWLDEWLYGEA
jgi:hypothetical protein